MDIEDVATAGLIVGSIVTVIAAIFGLVLWGGSILDDRNEALMARCRRAGNSAEACMLMHRTPTYYGGPAPTKEDR